MIRPLYLSSLFCSTAMLASAGSWSGVLVDARCFTSMGHNRGDVPSFVNWDRNGAIEFCSPKEKTDSFAIVQADGLTINLDAQGNEQAHELLDSDKKSLYVVDLTGERDRDGIKVNKIWVVRRVNRWGKR